MKKGIWLILITIVGLIIVIVTGDLYQKNMLEKTKTSAQGNEDNNKNIKENSEEEYSEIYSMLMNREITNILLLGDSITAGVGIPSHYTPPENPIIFDNGTEQFRESAYTTKAWANDLREYAAKFEIEDFTNAGIGGKSAKWALENIDYLLENADLVFVMYGTNDRTQGTIDDFEKNIQELLSEIDDRSSKMVVMSPPPSANDYYEFYFAPKDIDAVLKKISKENGYTFISHFDGINNHINENEDIYYEDLMQTSGAHPTELGYKVMWKTIQDELGLK